MKGLLALYLFSLAIAITSMALSIASLVHPDWVIVKPFNSHGKHPSESPINLTLSTTYGLFETCTTTTYSAHTRGESGLKSKKECRKFPVRGLDCKGPPVETKEVGIEKKGKGKGRKGKKTEGEAFCDRWLLAGYSHQLSLIFSLTSILSLSLTLIGTCTVGRGYRTEKLRSGWKLVVGLMSFQAATLLLSWLIVRVEFGNKRNHLFTLPFGHKNLGPAFRESVAAFALLLVAVGSILFVRATQKLRIVPEGAGRDDGYDEIEDEEN